MINIIFENAQGKEQIIGIVAHRQEAMKIIMSFLKEHNYHSYYQRLWEEGNDIKIDYGSYTQFFILRATDGSKLSIDLED